MNRNCECCGKQFAIDKQDVDFYQKIEVPHPTWCPSCREMRRMSWCNEGILYMRTCELCSKRSVSQFAPHNPRKAYCFHCWWSDRWQAEDYGRNLDLNRSILSQIKDLILAVPHCHTHTDLSNENSEYTHHAGHEKNCYMMFHCSFAEDCYYGYGVKKAISCVDNHYCHESELCFECTDVHHCYDLAWSHSCSNCSSGRFLYDCVGCKSCFLCVGLRDSEYCFLNEKLGKAEYQARIASYDLGSWSVVQSLLNKFKDITDKHPRRHLQMNMVENCLGDHLYKAKDCSACFDCSDIEHSKYCSQLQLGTRYCHDIYQFGIDIELCYDCAMIGYNIYNCHFCYDLLQQCSNLKYCISCHSTRDSFGCFGLKKQQYCILNKQYQKDDYETLLPKIIEKMKVDGEYGSFFPIEMSPHGYNETMAIAWYPKYSELVREKGWHWEDELPFSHGKVTLKTIPDNIRDIQNSITEEVLACLSCLRDFKIIGPELEFYRTHHYPLPRECFQCRRARRLRLREPRAFWTRRCDKCQIETPSTIHPDRNLQVYCEKCYLDLVY